MSLILRLNLHPAQALSADQVVVTVARVPAHVHVPDVPAPALVAGVK